MPPPYPGGDSPRLTYGANDEARLEECIVVEGICRGPEDWTSLGAAGAAHFVWLDRRSL